MLSIRTVLQIALQVFVGTTCMSREERDLVKTNKSLSVATVTVLLFEAMVCSCHESVDQAFGWPYIEPIRERQNSTDLEPLLLVNATTSPDFPAAVSSFIVRCHSEIGTRPCLAETCPGDWRLTSVRLASGWWCTTGRGRYVLAIAVRIGVLIGHLLAVLLLRHLLIHGHLTRALTHTTAAAAAATTAHRVVHLHHAHLVLAVLFLLSFLLSLCLFAFLLLNLMDFMSITLISMSSVKCGT